MEDTQAVLSLLGSGAVVLGVLAVFAFIVWVVLNARRKQKAREAFLLSQGFTRLQPPPEFLRRVEALYRHGAQQRFRVTALYQKAHMQGGSFYVFDMIETSGEENTNVANGSVAYISSDLSLPRLHISGRLAMEGKAGAWMAGMAEKVINWAATRIGMNRVDLSAHAEIDERLMVLAEDETAALAFLTRERLGRLLWLANPERPAEIDCSGDCFVLKRGIVRGSGEVETDQRSLLDDARRAYTALTDG